MTYLDKLKDPRWQKKRLEVFQRAGWKCQACGDKQRTLQVHHLKYGEGEPWEVPDSWLESLCDECHEMREQLNAVIGRSLCPTQPIFMVVADCLGPSFRDRVRKLLPEALRALTPAPQPKVPREAIPTAETKSEKIVAPVGG